MQWGGSIFHLPNGVTFFIMFPKFPGKLSILCSFLKQVSDLACWSESLTIKFCFIWQTKKSHHLWTLQQLVRFCTFCPFHLSSLASVTGMLDLWDYWLNINHRFQHLSQIPPSRVWNLPWRFFFKSPLCLGLSHQNTNPCHDTCDSQKTFLTALDSQLPFLQKLPAPALH